ncbi:MAG: Crp/Fnr family transcriptional regulator [Pseudomonadales bacterium]|nr:Crp/Fnr family transcriptional regulator [Pseudomonadales bacterium]
MNQQQLTDCAEYFLSRFESLGATDIRELIPDEVFRVHRLAKSETLVACGTQDNRLYLVIDGLLKIDHVTENGRHYVRAFLREDMFYATLSSILTQLPNQCTVQAIEPCTICSIPFSCLQTGLDQSLKLNIAWRRYMEQHFIRHERRELDLLGNDARQRYINFIRDYPSLESRIPNHLIAAYLGVTEQSLSRIKRNLT